MNYSWHEACRRRQENLLRIQELREVLQMPFLSHYHICFKISIFQLIFSLLQFKKAKMLKHISFGKCNNMNIYEHDEVKIFSDRYF